jgi:hypothetical protein
MSKYFCAKVSRKVPTMPHINIEPFFYLQDEDAVVYELHFATPGGFVWRCEVHEKQMPSALAEARALAAALVREAA